VVEERAQRASRDQPLTAGSSRVKEARKLSRRSVRAERRLFLADGPKAVEGALGAGCVVEVFVTRAALEEYAVLVARAERVTVVEDRALASLSDSVSPAGLVAICSFVDVALGKAVEATRAGRGLLAICADVRDPGNAGTLLRTADAMGADAIVLAGHSVDAYNPKTVRASVGSLFQLPVALEPEAPTAVRAAREAGLTVLAADGAGELDLADAGEILAGPTAWVFGNEAWGIPAELAALADHRVTIPIRGRAESLNLAAAAAICLYESARRR
jgi:TrmH family RNA methyltransferase